ncbi:class I SAM-dependent methyltransferase [Aliikangiella coralliicola]|uniref:Class I SAM-dependent methyltransferase n=1 Tax=Aliikangiella coralliicola TaxID=2592383 RepID=A0A545UE38_9GAMM|nr:class I SAM-dependent methyltransferase [Aliikangiella coralliicola]TQV87729.1 class I SAM-dependent methyltransferase [Aliikangiella coralliicola]
MTTIFNASQKLEHPDSQYEQCKDAEHDHEWTDEVAQWYAEKYGDWPTTYEVVKHINWRSKDNVVDIGCGTGSTLRAISNYVKHGQLFGVDPMPVMLKVARETSNDNRLNYLSGSAECLPLDNASIDKVISVNSFHHWRNIIAGLAEVKRVLTSTGRLFIAEDLDVMKLSGMDAQEIQQHLLKANFEIEQQQLIRHNEIEFILIEASLPAEKGALS